MTAQEAVLFPDCSLGGKAAEMAGRIYLGRVTLEMPRGRSRLLDEA